MTAVVSREVNGKFATVGTTDKCIFSHYKTIKGLIKYGVNPYGNGKRCKIEIYYNDNIYRDPNKVLEVETYKSTP